MVYHLVNIQNLNCYKSGAIWVMDKFSELNFLTKFYNEDEQIAESIAEDTQPKSKRKYKKT